VTDPTTSELERIARQLCEASRGAGAWDKPKVRAESSVNDLRAAFKIAQDGSLIRRVATGYKGCHKAGEIVGSLTKNGYLKTKFDGGNYLVHRIIFAIANGHWPCHQIDHIDGNRTNNRPENLRDVPPFINSQNLHKARSSNTNGCLGVTGSLNRWRAEIRIDGRKVSLGTFEDKQDAANAYLDKKRRVHAGCTI
jgi:hypothetical protein